MEIVFPSQFGNERSFDRLQEGSKHIVLQKNSSLEMLEAFREINPVHISSRLSLINNDLLFEDVDTNESFLHESVVDSLCESLRTLNFTICQASGIRKLLKIAANYKLIAGVPDITCTGAWKNSTTEINFIVEVCYGIGIHETHQKVQDFFQHYPSLRAAIIIDIKYPRSKFGPYNLYHNLDGKICLFYYNRMNINPQYGLSFGNSPITQVDIDYYVANTGIAAANIRGYKETVDSDLPCDNLNLGMYQISIPPEVLFHSVEPYNPLTGPMLAHLQSLGIDNDSLTLNIDLFALKSDIISEGIRSMNQDILNPLGVRLLGINLPG